MEKESRRKKREQNNQKREGDMIDQGSIMNHDIVCVVTHTIQMHRPFCFARSTLRMAPKLPYFVWNECSIPCAVRGVDDVKNGIGPRTNTYVCVYVCVCVCVVLLTS